MSNIRFKIKSKILATLLLTSIILSACIPSQVEDLANRFSNDNNSGVLAEDAITIIWWGLFEEEENIAPLIEQFELNNPGVTIDYAKKDKDTYENELISVLTDGNPNTTPDIYTIHNTWTGNYESYTSNAPASIFSIDDFKSDFHNFVSEDFGYGDQVRGVPLWVDLLGLVYHQNLLFKTGDTIIANDWNNFRTQAINMTEFDGTNVMTRGGFSGGMSQNVEFSADIVNLFLLQGRNTVIDAETRLIPFEDEEAEQINEAITFYRNFNQKTWNANLKLDTAAFIEGDLASIILPSWRILDILKFNEEKNLGFNIKTAPVPQLNFDSSEKVNVSTYWGYVVSSDSAYNNKSWEFLKFISQKDTQQIYKDKVIESGRPFSLISPRKDMLEEYSTDQYLSSYVEQIPYTHNWYMVNGNKLSEDFDALVDGSGTLDNLLENHENLIINKDTLQ